MKFSMIITLLSLSFSPIFTTAITLAFDQTYDASSTSLSTVACSDGVNGLESRFPTFGDLPSFPNIGAASAVEGWNSANCGTCWQLTYTGARGIQQSIIVTTVDHAGDGFNIALAPMNKLTDNMAEQLGRVNVTSTQVPASACGL